MISRVIITLCLIISLAGVVAFSEEDRDLLEDCHGSIKGSPWGNWIADEIAAGRFVPLETVDKGKLKKAFKSYLDAHMAGDLNLVMQSLLALPFNYSKVARAEEEDTIKNFRLLSYRDPMGAQPDAQNPLHFRVYVNVVIRVDEACIEDMFGGEWVKLDGRWQRFPPGYYIE